VTVPTLLAHGADDQDTPVAIAHALAARIPGAGLHVFEGKGHLPLFTATNEFCTMLRAFVMGGAPAEVPPPGNLPVSKADTSRF
jgi:pimeloyl-ACP methyl ester carboxylesterase